jgi:hypothetical protein
LTIGLKANLPPAAKTMSLLMLDSKDEQLSLIHLMCSALSIELKLEWLHFIFSESLTIWATATFLRRHPLSQHPSTSQSGSEQAVQLHYSRTIHTEALNEPYPNLGSLAAV